MTKPNKYEVRNARPVYDWSDGDVWRFIQEMKLDYKPVTIDTWKPVERKY
mgnify:CR=1 FL=1